MRRLIIVALLSQLTGCFFVFIPGSLIQRVVNGPPQLAPAASAPTN